MQTWVEEITIEAIKEYNPIAKLMLLISISANPRRIEASAQTTCIETIIHPTVILPAAVMTQVNVVQQKT